ncbi:DNase I-like protein [Dacryopinax primogenitus]|uniref:DNase I-like protein n=1 Tax=Dacryopinax primogenitus (strain DJM 731) TaxID=1858805 RepID=M5G7X1_DACPD|nr:DNase I-like protein [Dacryopinax primogenitus]EJT99867.1 DNase I-like protein [Dacryopinax primogenitus]
MHESLPHGDLRSLLGYVPPHEPLELRGKNIPYLPRDDTHPFHLVVIAGQECPTHSGIPMGLGATFKDRHKDKDKQSEREASRRDKEKERDRQRHSRNVKADRNTFVAGTMSSWSAILEDWLQNGVGSISGVQPALEQSSDPMNRFRNARGPMDACVSAAVAVESNSEETIDSTHEARLSEPNVAWNISEQGGTATLSAEQARLRAGVKGPYVLLCKERLMGIYIAVFVQRDCRPLLRDYSTGTVAAGLMGGRVGNKGGVGVSVFFADTRLLFINAHLAAHEGKVALRLANLHKIKCELEVDSFLPSDDPRLLSEDVTDRFDYTFVFGDLNFRLDLTRLHADWLISRKEYAQALEFDQLHKLIQEGKVDLQEEPPRFPPTYKYDVRRRSMRDTTVGTRAHVHRALTNTVEPLNETDEHAPGSDQEDDDVDEHEQGSRDFESSSFISSGSAWTGTASTTWTTDADDEEGEDSDGNVVSSSLAVATQAAQKLLGLPAAQKAKTKFMDFIGRPISLAASNRPTFITPETLNAGISDVPKSVSPSPDQKLPVTHSTSTKTHLSRATLEDNEPMTYDSSSKQRVPSWCDRILWKTTLVSGCEHSPVSEHRESMTRSGLRRGYFGNALSSIVLRSGPPLGRQRRNSTSSTTADSRANSSDCDSSRSLHHSPTTSTILFNPNMTASAERRAVKNGDESCALASEPPPAKPFSFDTNIPLTQWHPQNPESRSTAGSVVFPPFVAPIPSPPRLPPVFAVSSLMPTLEPDEPRPSTSTGSSSKWWRHLPGLLTRASAPEPCPVFPSQPEHHRGDVVVLSYKTLDDLQMKTLDGRSDHRPVIGSYAAYV